LLQLRSQLELAMRALERGQRKEDADAVEAALVAVTESEGSAELLTDATKAARKCVEQWHALNASDAKLQRMLRDGASTAQLARAIQEASAAGVKVVSAKRTLKVRLCHPSDGTPLHRQLEVLHVKFGGCY
jgi:K+-sensing histidine kinase KdpD